MKKLVLILALALAGCATVITGGNQKVHVSSTALNGRDVHASFEVRNTENNQVVATGITPSVVRLPAGDGYFGKAHYQVNFEKDGYIGDFVTLDPTLNPWYFGNLILGGWPGMLIVDPLTGAMWKLQDHAYGAAREPSVPKQHHYRLPE